MYAVPESCDCDCETTAAECKFAINDAADIVPAPPTAAAVPTAVFFASVGAALYLPAGAGGRGKPNCPEVSWVATLRGNGAGDDEDDEKDEDAANER